MKKIYFAAYKDFKDYNLLKKVVDYMLSKTDKNNITFFVTYGENGDNTCMKYVREGKFKYVDWCKNKLGNRAKQKLPFIKESTCSILVTDGISKGIGIAIRYSAMFVKDKLVIIKPYENVFSVWKNGKMIAEKEII